MDIKVMALMVIVPRSLFKMNVLWDSMTVPKKVESVPTPMMVIPVPVLALTKTFHPTSLTNQVANVSHMAVVEFGS
jgi:hypothetical protein